MWRGCPILCYRPRMVLIRVGLGMVIAANRDTAGTAFISISIVHLTPSPSWFHASIPPKTSIGMAKRSAHTAILLDGGHTSFAARKYCQFHPRSPRLAITSSHCVSGTCPSSSSSVPPPTAACAPRRSLPTPQLRKESNSSCCGWANCATQSTPPPAWCRIFSSVLSPWCYFSTIESVWNISGPPSHYWHLVSPAS